MSTKIQLKPTRLADVVEVQPTVFRDDRGFFLESWNLPEFQDLGLKIDFVQDNHSQSKQGTLRGLHYQLARPQGKLVRVASGRVFDVAVDLRSSSPTLGEWVGIWLTAEKMNMLWIPPGFAHGFYVQSPTADLLYKCTDIYFPKGDRTIRWDDPDLDIGWPIDSGIEPILSAKDSAGERFRAAELFP